MSKLKKLRDKHKKSGAMAKWREKAGGEDFGNLFSKPDGMKNFSLKSADTYYLDVIPYSSEKGNEYVNAGEQWWEKTFYVHKNIGVNNEWVVCLARTFQKPCPICEFRSKLDKDPEADEKTIEALKPSKRIVTNVVNLKKKSDGVQIFHIAHWFFGKALKVALDAAYEDHEDNMDEFFKTHYLKCTVEEAEGGFSGYNVVRVDFKKRKEDLDEETLEQAVNLDDVLIVKTYDELKEMLHATETEDVDEDLDDDEKEEKKSKKDKKKESKKSGKKKDEEDDEDSDDDDDNVSDDDVENEDWDDEDSSDDDDDDDKASDEDDDDSDDDDSSDEDENDDDDGGDNDDDDEGEDEEDKKEKSKKKHKK